MGPDEPTAKLLADAQDTAEAQRDIAALADRVKALPDVVAVLRAASEAHLDRAFTVVLLAALHAGVKVPADVLVRGARLLPSVDAFAAVADRMDGDVGAALVAAVRGRGLDEREPGALLVAELWARRSGKPRPDGVLPEARIRARRQVPLEAEDALIALGGLVDDPDLNTLVDEFSSPEARDAARALTSRLVDRMLGKVLEVFPARPQAKAKGQGPVRRAVAKVGRNDPCPCGSGKKYKQCHEAEDRERLAESSDVEGLTLRELQQDLERHLTEERVGALRGHELARLDPARIRQDLRSAWISRLCMLGEVDAAVVAIESWAGDGPLDEVLDDLLRLVAEHAAKMERVDLARRLLARRGSEDQVLLEARVVLRDDPAERMALLEASARAALDVRGVDLGFALISAGWPALGVHVARSELALRPRDGQADALYALLLETRDALAVGPWDAIDDVLYLLDHGVAAKVDQELAEARTKADQGDAALRATQEALETVKAELERRETAAREEAKAAPSDPVSAAPEKVVQVVDDAAVRDLRTRVDQLKGELKDRHRERNALRRELEEAKEQMAELQARDDEPNPDSQAEGDDDDEGPVDQTVAARIRVPVLPDDFGARLREVPEATARAALVKLGELCAGYDLAFREVRPLRGFDGTWRAKVGRSYRLLFRPHDHTLEVLELLHRQDLEKRLFRLRRAGEG